METRKRIKNQTSTKLSLDQFNTICQEKMKSVENYINQTTFASQNDKQQAIQAAETKLYKEINELGKKNQINVNDIQDCISALEYEYQSNNESLDIVNDVKDNVISQEENILHPLQLTQIIEQDLQQSTTNDDIQNESITEQAIQQAEPIVSEAIQQAKPIISDEDREECHRNRIWRQSLRLRTNNAISKLYNYQKFNKGYVQEIETGKAIDISKCPYLAVVDIDIDKKLDEQQRKIIRDELLQQLNSNKSLKVGLVQTAHGGIHIYCSMSDYKLRQNSMNGIIKSLESNPLNKRYGVDVFACVTPYNEESKEKTLRWVVLPDSIVKDKDSDVELQYINLNKMWNITKLSSIKKVFQTLKFDMNLILNIDKPKVTQLPALVVQESSQQITNDQEVIDEFTIKYIQRDKSYDISKIDSKIDMTQQTCILLCNGLKGLEIHNDAQELKKEITFLVLFKSINSLIKIDGIDEKFINDVYQRIRTMNNLTDSAKQHFDSQRERYKNEMTNPYILQGIVRDYNPTYYKDVIMKQLDKTKNDDNTSTSSVSMKSQSSYRSLDKTQIHISKIDLDDPFTLVDIEMKIYNQEYECDEDIVTDMLRIMRIINQKNDIFIMKRYDSSVKRCTFDILSDDAAQKKLSKAKWDGFRKKNLKLWSLFQECAGVFRLRDIQFISDEQDVFSIFQGWKHKQLDEINMDAIQLYLDLIKEVIAANDNHIYEYILNWISFIIQHPGIKSKVAIVIRGVQGTGKNTFTDVLCDLMAGYSAKNITDIEEITGNFNAVIENKSLIVLNELKNFTEQRALNSNALKSVITDDVQRINEKFVARRDSQNVANLIFISNNYCPVKIEATDRRYLVCQTPDAHRHNFEHFDKIHQAIKQADFYDNLLTFFMKRDISQANLQVIPMTDAKKDIQKVSKSPVENFVVKYLKQLKQGMECNLAVEYKPKELTEFQFKAQLKAICDYERKNAPNSKCTKKIGYYKLKPGLIQDYESIKDEENEINDDDDDNEEEDYTNLKIIPNDQDGDVINQ